MADVPRTQRRSAACGFCAGTGKAKYTAYTRNGVFHVECVRCGSTGVEPLGPKLHPAVLLRNRRSQKVWAIYGEYVGEQATPPAPGERAWGIHRMIPDRVNQGHYVWQIRVMPERVLLANWEQIGYGDAWEHDLMESDPLREHAHA